MPVCQYQVRKTKNNPEGGVCGKKATNVIDGIYYCGNPRTDGTYTAHMGMMTKRNAKDKDKPSTKPRRSFSSKTSDEIKDSALVKKILKNKIIHLSRKTIDGKTIWVHEPSSICFEQETKCAYGKLCCKSQTIIPLDQDARQFLDTHKLHEKPEDDKIKEKILSSSDTSDNGSEEAYEIEESEEE